MRVPKIKVKMRKASLQLKVKTVKVNSGCAKHNEKYLDHCTNQIYNCVRHTRSMSRLMKKICEIIIYETYRCMPLLGNEKLNAPDWEEHIVRYHIVFVTDKS